MSDAIPRHIQVESVSGIEWGRCPETAHEVSKLLNTRVPIIERDGPFLTPCFVWQGCVDAQGYADRGRRKHDRAHRQIWELVHGPRPAGYVLHHRCEEKLCLNVAHMDLVTAGHHAHVHHPKPRDWHGRFQDTASLGSQS